MNNNNKSKDEMKDVETYSILLEKELLLKSILDNTESAICFFDIDYRVKMMNRKALENLGWKNKNIEEKTLLDIFMNENAEYHKKRFDDCIESGNGSTYEDEVELSSGKIWFLTDYQPIKDEKDQVVGIQTISTDITDRKKIEENLKNSEERLRDIIYSTSDFVWEVDTQGRYTFASGRVQDVLGYSPEELIGKTPFDIMPEDERVRMNKVFVETIDTKDPVVDLENWNITKQGKKVCLLTNGVPIIGKNGDLLGYRGVDKDITKRKKAEEDLEKQMENMERFSRLTVGREHRMIELKKEVNDLLKSMGSKEKYKINVVKNNKNKINTM